FIPPLDRDREAALNTAQRGDELGFHPGRPNVVGPHGEIAWRLEFRPRTVLGGPIEDYQVGRKGVEAGGEAFLDLPLRPCGRSKRPGCCFIQQVELEDSNDLPITRYIASCRSAEEFK